MWYLMAGGLNLTGISGGYGRQCDCRKVTFQIISVENARMLEYYRACVRACVRESA